MASSRGNLCRIRLMAGGTVARINSRPTVAQWLAKKPKISSGGSQTRFRDEKKRLEKAKVSRTKPLLNSSEERLCALDADCLELVGIESKQFQNCWGDLRGLHRR